MELEHSFVVPVPLDRAWDVLLDVERVAPCMPGATLDSVSGDDISGKIRVKVGPISMTYSGQARFTERNREAGIVRLEASGKEMRGAGTAAASVRSELVGDGDKTSVTVLTSLSVTGKPAQFGRGVLNEVGGRLVGIFATNLAQMLEAGNAAQAASPEPATPAARADKSAAVTPTLWGGDAPSGTDDLTLSIEDLSLPLRAYNSLRRDGLHTVGDLVARTSEQLLAMDNIGPASVEEIRRRLADRGLSLRPSASVNSMAGHRDPGPDAVALVTSPAEEAPAADETPAAETALPAETASAAERALPVERALAADATPAAEAPLADAAPAAAAETAPAAAAEISVAETAPVVPAARPESGPPASWRPDDEAIDLLNVAGVPVLKRALPVAAGLVGVAVVALGIRRLRRRRG